MIISAWTEHRFCRLITSLALVLILVVWVKPVLAHGYIVRAIPEDRAVLERSPVRLQYWFSESLEPEFSALTVRDEVGNIIAEGGVDEDNHALLKARLPTNLPDGAYLAELRTAFASDGHVIVETRAFFIGEQVIGVEGTAADDRAIPLEVVWRMLILTATTLLLGTFGLYALVLVPAWGNKNYPAGLLPPRVMSRLNLIIAVSLGVAFSGNILALLQQSMTFFGTDLERVINDQLWSVVRTGTTFGDMWNFRMFMLLLVIVLHGASLHFRTEQPEAVRAFWIANVWVTVILVGTWSMSSHAAGSSLWPWLAIISDWLHGLAVGFWAGGLAGLVLILPIALLPYWGEARRAALITPLKRFSLIAVVCVVIVVTTGIYNALNWVYAPTMLKTTYSTALLTKVVLAAGLLTVGLVHYIALSPERFRRWDMWLRSSNVVPFMSTLRLEAVLALLVLGAVGLLSATPVPEPETVNTEVETPSGSIEIGEYRVDVSLAPGGPGVNTYDVVILQDGRSLENIPVYLQMVNPSMDQRGDWHELEPFGDGLFSSAGDEINEIGEWWTLIDILDPEGQRRAAFAWDITDEASVDLFRDPQPANTLALAGILTALAYAVYPFANRFYRRLDTSLPVVTIATLAIVLTISALIWMWVSVQQSQAEYEQVINPPPTVINPTLPNEVSLERGRRLLNESCTIWKNREAGSDSDLTQLAGRRDEEIFAATQDGWRGLPPCEDSLTTSQRWDLVNFVHTFEDRD